MEEKETYPFVINVKTIAGQSIKETCYAAARLSKQLGCLIETEINDVTITVGGLMTEQDAYESWLFYSKQKNNNMNKLPTPETDAAWSCFKGYMEPLQDVKDLSRKLERERDEAKRIYDIEATEHMLNINEICNQRDAAMDALGDISFYPSSGIGDDNTTVQEYKDRILDGIKHLKQERDEARDTIMKIEEIFIDSEDMHDDWMKVGNIAREYFKK